MVVAAASLVRRFRRRRGGERQQLRWLALAAALAPLVVLVTAAAIVIGQLAVAGWIIGLYLALLPLAIAAAIARYRLYDLDRIVSRTLAYGLLTLLLGGGYAAVVLGLGQLLGRDSSLVVAGATLAVAALFQPARRRIQTLVDRRFNRHRYDAARTIEAFSARLRQQVDLDTLTAELLAVVEQTMQPTQAWLWLRADYPRLNAMKRGLRGGNLPGATVELTTRRPMAMLHAGLDLSRHRLEVCLLDGQGSTVKVTAAPPDADGLCGLASQTAAHGQPVRAATWVDARGPLCPRPAGAGRLQGRHRRRPEGQGPGAACLEARPDRRLGTPPSCPAATWSPRSGCPPLGCGPNENGHGSGCTFTATGPRSRTASTPPCWPSASRARSATCSAPAAASCWPV
jgi:hypothetical protein